MLTYSSVSRLSSADPDANTAAAADTATPPTVSEQNTDRMKLLLRHLNDFLLITDCILNILGLLGFF